VKANRRAEAEAEQISEAVARVVARGVVFIHKRGTESVRAAEGRSNSSENGRMRVTKTPTS